MQEIKRYFKDAKLVAVENDLGFLIDAVRKSHGELDFQIRPNDKINIYYKGNRLAEISIGDSYYTVSVHERFELENAVKKDRLRRFSDYEFKKNSEYVSVNVSRDLIHAFLQSSVLKFLMSKIKEVNNGEEIGFEQSLITDNLYRPDYIFIDRQVGGGGVPGMLDLLALRRMESGKYQFEAVEVKLGNNKELIDKVFFQIERYVVAIKENIGTFIKCYEKNYEQKKKLGLFPNEWDDNIEIEEMVTGKIVVGSYARIGEEYIGKLKKQHPNMPFSVQQFVNIIK